MKKWLILLVSNICMLNILQAQAPFPAEEEINRFFQTKTLVVLESNPFSAYNVYIKKAMADYWKITPYDFISFGKFEELKTDSTYSFLILTQINFEKDTEGASYNFLNLLLGKKSMEELTEMPEFCSFPLSYSPADEKQYIYKLGLIVRFMKNHVQLIKENPQKKVLQDLKYYNRNVPDVNKHKLIVARTDLAEDVNEMAEVKQVYRYPVEITDHGTIEKILEKKNEDAVILHKIGPGESNPSGRTYKIILGQDGTLYYFNYHSINSRRPDGFLKSDFNRLDRY